MTITLDHLRNLVIFGACTVLLAGCGGTDSIKPDQEVVLKPGDGIAAVVFDTVDTLNTVSIDSPDHKDVEIGITVVDKGANLFVFEVPAGTYCLTRFYTGFYRYIQEDPTHGVCFDVIAGKVAYSGNFAPGVYNGRVMTYQNYNWPGFEKTFKAMYPKLASIPIVTP